MSFVAVKGVARISKRAFYDNNGFAHPDQYRRVRGGARAYYWIIR